jgi:hypothetical protein
MRCLLLLSFAFMTLGCSSIPTVSTLPLIEIGVPDGGVWLPADRVDYYRCLVGILICRDPVGRLSDRFCHCLE